MSKLVDAVQPAVKLKFPLQSRKMQGPQYALTRVVNPRVILVTAVELAYCLVAAVVPMDEYLIAGLDEINRTFELLNSWWHEAPESHQVQRLVQWSSSKPSYHIDYALVPWSFAFQVARRISEWRRGG